MQPVALTTPGEWRVRMCSKNYENFLKDSNDPHSALLFIEPHLPWGGISQAGLLMGRKMRTSLPESEEHFTPQRPNLRKFRNDDKQYRKKQKYNYLFIYCFAVQVLKVCRIPGPTAG